MSKIYSRVYSYSILFIMILTLSACAVVQQTSSSSPSSPTPTSVSKEQKSCQTVPLQADRPRALASLRLTEQARILLESGKIDDAIVTLERAINVNPSNGQNYYYLAEAWLKKGNHSQAKEFNRLAAMYLRDEPEWSSRVNNQKKRISTR